MAEHLVKLIPCLHTYRTNVNRAAAAVEALKKVVEAEEITFRQTDQPEFVDCGSDLSKIRCPKCGAPLAREWWLDEMERMYQEDHFFVLEREMPCCEKTANFNQLHYEAPCGFSCLEFIIRNPEGPVGKEAVDALSERFGLLFRKVEAFL